MTQWSFAKFHSGFKLSINSPIRVKKRFDGIFVLIMIGAAMKLVSNYLLLKWLPTTKVGLIHMPNSELDYHNSDSVKMFKVLAAGPGRTTRKGAFIPNEIHPGDNVILDTRISGRPQEMEDGTFVLTQVDQAVIAVVPMQNSIPSNVSASVEC